MSHGLLKHDVGVLRHVRANVADASHLRFKMKQAASSIFTLYNVREDVNHVICECA